MSQSVFFVHRHLSEGAGVYADLQGVRERHLVADDQKLANEDWPSQSIDEFFFLPSPSNAPEDLEKMIVGLSHYALPPIDRVVALDDFDVEKRLSIGKYFGLMEWARQRPVIFGISSPCGAVF